MRIKTRRNLVSRLLPGLFAVSLAIIVFQFPLEAEVLSGRYIVELSEHPAARYLSKRGGENAPERRAQIRTEQLQARQELQRLGAEVVDAVETVANALIVHVPDAKAPLLASIPGVVRVHPVRRIKPLLDHALPLHKVPDAWAQIGGIDSAGAGIKIGILDTGIDSTHPGFQDDSLPVPDGFPRVNGDSDVVWTNHKVIVARNYGYLLNPRDPTSAGDHNGHGTAVAMAAAGVPNTGPFGVIAGVAPKAYLGNYKVFLGTRIDELLSDDAVMLKALDDAVADGMDAVNMSFGDLLARRPVEDILDEAVEEAAMAGVLVVVAAGNEGSNPNTINSPGTTASAITVGASVNDRIFAGSVTVEGSYSVPAIPGNGPDPMSSITGPLLDVSTLDPTGLACQDLPTESLSGRIAFILRGECFFEIKLNNAQEAGAVAAIVYTDAARPDPIIMDVRTATLPAVMVSHANGIQIKRQLETTAQLSAALQFSIGPVPVDSNRLADFSSRGPNVDDTIKPDLLAVGTSVYTATQRLDSDSELFHETGYLDIDGTSFSSPLVAGAAAVLKAARPGLSFQQYRSLLINSASPFLLGSNEEARVQQAGAGLLNLASSLQGMVAAYPTSLSFGVGNASPDVVKDLIISNAGAASDTFTISISPRADGPAPSVSTDTFQLDPGSSANVTVRFSASSLNPGEYQGFLQIRAGQTEAQARIPYWYAVPSDVPDFLTILSANESATAGIVSRGAIIFRVTDSSGVALLNVEPLVTTISGDGAVIDVVALDSDIPGAWGVNLRLAPGNNIFRIQVGDLQREVSIHGESTATP
ncbi:MAG: S8 family serine peptidase [Acidobacteria bacterium]|nr:S8 family serine peptidase [Acidobacteriota bacterium]